MKYPESHFTPLSKYKPPRSGRYYVLCGDGETRRAKYLRHRGQPSCWADEMGYGVAL